MQRTHPVVVLVLVGNAAGPHFQQQNCKAVHIARLGHLVVLQHLRSQVRQGTCISSQDLVQWEQRTEGCGQGCATEKQVGESYCWHVLPCSKTYP